MLEFETEFQKFEAGSTVLCWDSVFEKSGNSDDKLPCHGKIGMIIDRAEATDMDSNGKPLGSRAENCFLVMFVDAKDLTPKVVHSQWLKLVDAEA